MRRREFRYQRQRGPPDSVGTAKSFRWLLDKMDTLPADPNGVPFQTGDRSITRVYHG